MFDNEENEELYKLVSMQKIEQTLGSFAKDKIPSPYGWTMEFHIHFFDLFGRFLLNIVEEARLRGNISGAINSTFLALILEKSSPKTLRDFRPISLCNILYKVISKVIVQPYIQIMVWLSQQPPDS